MIFKKIFVEKQVYPHPQTRQILQQFPEVPYKLINKIEDVFGRVKKPYLQKRTHLHLFIGRKEGQLVKKAPAAYGVNGELHYYFIHAYNCIYECEYCYLQGYFHSPDLVCFVNHDEIIKEIENVVAREAGASTVWFHAGEFSDSLALSHISNEWGYYWDAFQKMANARLELRTKSVNIGPILKLPPLNNIVLTFSLAPESISRKYEHKTPSLKGRLKAIRALLEAGYRIGLHFDPIIYEPHFEKSYRELIDSVLQFALPEQIEYISLGVVRFTRAVYREFAQNYPESGLLTAELLKSVDNKIRYMRPQRLFILKTIRNFCHDAGIHPEKVYLCMEDET